MRQGQHKNRSRGRNQRRGGGGNSANRVYESNGPDVKVRGTAQTVADKYLQLARDAVSSGDIVMSESYFQHAEHYMRIIAANQSQQQQQQQSQPRQQDNSDEPASDSSDDSAVPGTGPQPDAAAAKDDEAKPAQTRRRGNGRDREKPSEPVEGFDGELPGFLKKPVEETAAEEKPKRTRRASKPKAAEQEGAEDSDGGKQEVQDAKSDASDKPGSDAEVAVG